MLASLHDNVSLQIDTIATDVFSANDMPLHIARLDLVDAEISGNKWFKLRRNLQVAQQGGVRHIVSFGGAWSNHLHALAAAGARFGFDTTGIVRGEPAHGLTAMLRDAQRWGMQIRFVDRAEYRRRGDNDYLAEIAAQYAPCLTVPEGGSNALGVDGCEEIGRALAAHDRQVNAAAHTHHVLLATATGSTLAGIARVLGEHFCVHAITVLHAHESVRQALSMHAPDHRCTVRIEQGFEHGGYAKTTSALLAFMQQFESRYGIALDHVYTGKAMQALISLHADGAFAGAACVTFLHTGGLQGRRGLQQLQRQSGNKNTALHAASAMTGWE